MTRPAVNGERLLTDLAAINQFGRGAPGDGVTRLAFTPPEVEARRWLLARLAEAGLEALMDGAGTIFATTPSADGPVVWSGSHTDTVVRGGEYDGTLGVICALEVVRRIHELGLPLRHPVGLINFACEESARFGGGCVGSRLVTDVLAPSDLENLVDREGLSFLAAARSAGFDPTAEQVVTLGPERVKAFLELHVEQGRELEDAGIPVGVVTAIASPWRWWLDLVGEQAHSGGAAMADRKDALAGAAEVILAVEEIGRQWVGREIRCTVGIIRPHPGLMNTVAGRVEVGLDVRGTRVDDVMAVQAEVEAILRRVSDRRGLSWEMRPVWTGSPYLVGKETVSLLEDAARTRGLQWERLMSWGGHDAMYMGRVGAAGMLFVRNPTGLSHNPAEAARPADIVAAANLLLEAMIRLAGSEEEGL